MEIQQFTPTQKQQELFLDALIPGQEGNAIAKTLFLYDLRSPDETLEAAYYQGFDYIAVEGSSPAHTILKYSDLVKEIAFRIVAPFPLIVYQIIGEPVIANPSEDLDDIDNYMGIPKPGDEQFAAKRGTYSEWRLGWWREVLQNSVDACIKMWEKHGIRGEIKCEIKHLENGGVETTVIDNGIGMNLQTLVDAFLVLGGSGKREDEGAAGGLGKAKELLFHSWERWYVHTRTLNTPPEKALFALGKFSPNTYPQCRRKSDGSFTATQGQTAAECKKSWLGHKKKAKAGTKVVVRMLPDEHVNRQDLEAFIHFSHLPNIVIKFREVWRKGKKVYASADEDALEVTPDTHWERLKAENKVSKSPVALLRRNDGSGSLDDKGRPKDGSVWAAVYHTPKAKKFTKPKVIVRVKGLYMFTPNQTETSYSWSDAFRTSNIPGKVIIELRYKKKHHNWDADIQDWVPMSKEDAEAQKITHYGPLEMMVESRDSLRLKYQSVLNSFVSDIKDQPSLLKKSRPPRIIRTKNKYATPKDWSKVFAEVSTQEIPKSSDLPEVAQTFKDLEVAEVQEKAKKIVWEEYDWDLDDEELPESMISEVSETLKESLTDNEISTLKEGGTGTGIGGELSLLDEQIKKMTTAISTRADWGLWYEKLVPAISKIAKIEIGKSGGKSWEKEKKEQAFTENMYKWLNWQPDFLLHDEAGSAVSYAFKGESVYDNNENIDAYGHLIKRADDHFSPNKFRKKEKKLAKLWVECIRLAFILIGSGSEIIDPDKVGLPLQAGFFFENPPDEYDDDANSMDVLGMYRTYSGEDDEYRALLLSPAHLLVEKKGNRWKHRYSISDNNHFAQFIAIVFHEVAHAIHNIPALTDMHLGDVDDPSYARRRAHYIKEMSAKSHDEKFANILTHDGIRLGYLYSTLFNKIRVHLSGLYKEDEDKDKKQPILPGRGYYKVDRPSGPGADPEYATLKEAMRYIDEKWSDYDSIPIKGFFCRSDCPTNNKGATLRKHREHHSSNLYQNVRYPYDDYYSNSVKNEQEGLDFFRKEWPDEIHSIKTYYPFDEESYDPEVVWKRNPDDDSDDPGDYGHSDGPWWEADD
jgi:hypothetical protein